MGTSAGVSKLFVAGLLLLVLALLVFVQAVFDLGPFIPDSISSEIVVLYSLSTFVSLVLIVFGLVLARNLFKLWVERRARRPGSRFKTQLVVSLIGLTLVPSVLLFVFAFGLVNRSIDKWFSQPVDNLFAVTSRVAVEWDSELETAAAGILSQLAENPPANLDSAAADFRLDAIAVFDSETLEPVRSSGTRADMDLLAGEMARRGSPGAPALFEIDGRLAGVASLEAPPAGRAIGVLYRSPRPFQELTEAIADDGQSYYELREDRRFYRDTYVQILVLIAILVLFAAVWTGLYLSKRITVPIEALALATREISAGNLDHRVEAPAGDELGMLVRQFNDMADELQSTSSALDERSRYTETILESIPTGVISIDDALRITKINRAARTMLSVQDPVTLADVFSRDDLEPIQELLDSCSEEGTATRELTLETPERQAHSAVIARRLGDGGFVLVVEDLTDMVKAQKATAWREVARRLAHEIKNPLTPIQLSAERISRNMERLSHIDDRTTGVVRECVDSIIGEVDSLKELVDEFGRVARLPAAAMKSASLEQLIERTLALYEDRLDGTVVSLVFPDDMPDVLIDSQQIKRVLINLIDNALDAMAGTRDKRLRIECALVRDRAMARLTITDSGHGIAPEDRARLFTPYFSTRKNGTGLGLSIASRIVADHGGYIGAESNGGGARFVIELPVCQESSSSTTKAVYDAP